jgi:signal transduction histidine kinase
MTVLTGQTWLLDRRRRLTSLDRRRPWLLDTAGTVALALVSVPSVIGEIVHGVGPGPAVLGACAGALVVPVWWRRRAPVAAFAAVAVLLVGEWTFGVWLGADVALLIVLLAVALRAPLRSLAVAAGVTVALLAYGIIGLHPVPEHALAALLLSLGTSTAAVATGLMLRTRRAYLTALEDRAARLETERDQRARLAAADERARVAREMHDVVGHHVSVIVGLADGAARLAGNRGESTGEPLRLIGETGRQALGELRRILGVLRSEQDSAAGLRPQPGVGDIDRLLPTVRAAGVPVVYRTSGEPHRLGPGLQLAIYRIVQEGLTNTLKHGGPGAAAEVTVAADGRQVHVRVTDTGRGAGRAPADDGHGIAGVRERAALYGGVVTAGPAPSGTGWALDAVLPAVGEVAPGPPAAERSETR